MSVRTRARTNRDCPAFAPAGQDQPRRHLAWTFAGPLADGTTKLTLTCGDSGIPETGGWQVDIPLDE